MAVDLAPERLAAFADLVNAFSQVRIDIRDVWHVFAKTFPGRTPGAEERELLAVVLAKLASTGFLKLPSTRTWDRSLSPPLPRWIERMSAPVARASADWRAFAWHSKLAWVPDLARLTDEELAFLCRVQEHLVRGDVAELAPVKYRSLELTGDEKALDRLQAGRLFRSGRLSLELLRCRADPTPLAWTKVGEEPLAIAFENAGAYAAAVAVLRTMPRPPYGAVIFGDGNRFERSCLSLGDLHAAFARPVAAVHYVGDLDAAGLRIAFAASAAAARAGLPRIVAAFRAHAAMFASAEAMNHPDGWPGGATDAAPNSLSFLAEEHRDRAHRMFAAHRRIPEEALGPAEMRRTFASL